MPSTAQMHTLSLLSDTVLYPEAVSFIQRLVHEQHCSPLPTSQAMGLLNVAYASKYAELYEFVKHQRDRNWPGSKSDIKLFYAELEKLLAEIQKKLLRGEYHLVEGNSNTSAARQEKDELMALLAREFIQHLVAENSLLAAVQTDEKAKERASRRR
jgi:hypothetical protein